MPNLAGLPVGWGAIFGFINLVLGSGAVVAWIKLRPKMRELNQSAEERLRDDLMARVEKLETAVEGAAALLQAERAQHEAEMTIMRHRVNNSDQCLDALLLLLKAAPEKVDQAVKHIEEMRERQKKEIAAEKGAQAGAKVATTAAAAAAPAVGTPPAI
jgi:hypothetical protein